ncbi:hypothetical protein WJX84_009448 [Apatococcus fuscideae]|uniref:Uncharacterized protein n=1 Tax=Apatococcus fuscideae TaxID=2026836 RepID=A0AAW1TK65_9CHLO
MNQPPLAPPKPQVYLENQQAGCSQSRTGSLLRILKATSRGLEPRRLASGSSRSNVGRKLSRRSGSLANNCSRGRYLQQYLVTFNAESFLQMTLDKAHLEYSNRRLETALKSNDAHLVRLNSHLGVRKIEQQMCLESLARFVNIIDGGGCDQASLDVIKQWPLRNLEDFYLRYLGKLGQLINVQGRPSDKHRAALTSVIQARRLHLSKDPYYSSLYWAGLSWNLHRQPQEGLQPPGRHQWAQLLTRLQLTAEQQQQMLTARQYLLHLLDTIGQTRWNIIVQLGQAALELPRESLPASPPAEALKENLEKERLACADFLFAITDEILSPEQEARCEVFSYPWHVDLLELCHILASRHGIPADLPDGVVYLQSRSPGLSKLMPLYTAYELLIMPLTCFGLGMYLKQGIILCPFQTVLSTHCYHLIDFDLLQRMTLFHAHYGFFQHDGQQTVFSVCAAAAHHDLVSASETADVSAQSAIAR